MGSRSVVGAAVVDVLTPFLGVHTSRRALAIACRAAGVDEESVAPGHVESICSTLLPMLRTLLGAESAERVVRAVKRRSQITEVG